MSLIASTWLGILLGAISLAAYRRRQHTLQQRDWSIAGISLRMHKSLLPPDYREEGKCDGKAGELIRIQFDKNGLVKDVAGTTLEGPCGHFRAGQSLRKLEQKLGRPDRTGFLTVRYYFSGIALDVSLYAQNRSLMTGFHITTLSGLAAVEYEEILAAKGSS